MAVTELDYMEYATDEIAQATYVSSDIDNVTKLLLHMNGSDGSTTFIDSSLQEHSTQSVVATCELDTAEKKWGTASVLFGDTMDTNTGYFSYADSADWDILTKTNFTIDLWVKHLVYDSPYTRHFINQVEDSQNRWFWRYNHGDGGFDFGAVSGGSTIISTNIAGQISDTNWHHIALIKVGNEYGIYLDGNQVCYVSDSDSDTFAGNLYIGCHGGTSNFIDGHLDEIRLTHNNVFGAAPNIGKTNTIVVPTVEHSLIDNLQCYSEASIKTQGSYSLKAVAVITDSLNDTLTKSGLSIDLSGKEEIKLDVYALRTGTNIQVQIHDSGGQTSTKDIVISSSNEWETKTWDISGIADVDKDDIDSIIIKIIEAGVANTFYIDNMYAQDVALENVVFFGANF